MIANEIFEAEAIHKFYCETGLIANRPHEFVCFQVALQIVIFT